FCVVQKNGGKDSPLQFRMDIVDCLIERYGKVSGKKGRPALQPNPMRLTERHFLEVIAPSERS
ncbi:piggyBac transposable element-derived protein 4, partial [Trichonephila clavipes]